MKSITQTLFMVGTAASLLQAACVGVPEPDEAVEEAQQGILVYNALSGDALENNPLVGNAATAQALVTHRLSGYTLSSNSLIRAALMDPDARDMLNFITSCALPANEHIDVHINGTTYGFDGALGLAAEWGQYGGSCDGDCQGWVSACVLSRVNHLGQHVTISLRGDHDALDSNWSERSSYGDREAAYFGNIFSQPQLFLACLSPGKTQIPRVCGSSIDDCVIDVIGDCDDACKGPKSDGSYRNCKVHVPGMHGKAKFPSTITVFLP